MNEDLILYRRQKSRETLEDAHILFQKSRLFSALNLSGLYSPKLASFLELLPTLRYPAACCGEVYSYILRVVL